jgi:putative membrane protein
MIQGPWERALNLASLHVDTTPGPVNVVALHLDADEVRAAMWDQAIRVNQGGGI